MGALLEAQWQISAQVQPCCTSWKSPLCALKSSDLIVIAEFCNYQTLWLSHGASLTTTVGIAVGALIAESKSSQVALG